MYRRTPFGEPRLVRTAEPRSANNVHEFTIRMLYPKIILAVLQDVNFPADLKSADFTQIKSRFSVESVKKSG